MKWPAWPGTDAAALVGRRYWWEAIGNDSRRAHEAISYIARLYELEVHFENSLLTGDALRDARQQHALPILHAFETWLKKEVDSVLPKSLIGQAFTYTRNQWQALCRYTADGALNIDNNIAERMVKKAERDYAGKYRLFTTAC